MENPSPPPPPPMPTDALAELLCLVLSEDDRISLKAVRRVRTLAHGTAAERDAVDAMGMVALFGTVRTPSEMVVRAELARIMGERRLARLEAKTDRHLKRLSLIERKARNAIIAMTLAVFTAFLTGYGIGSLYPSWMDAIRQSHRG